MHIVVISIFPELVSSLLDSGIPRKAVALGKLKVTTINPRDFADDSRKTVDDRPYGGGPGMVMKVMPLKKAIHKAKSLEPEAKVIYLSPQGKPLVQQKIRSFVEDSSAMILLAGRYEGIDERLVEMDVDEEISIGDYILSGGELGAMVLMDTISRLIPGVLGHVDSAEQDSFSDGLLDCPHFTRPEVLEGYKVPAVLLSGDHAAIAQWRRAQALGRTFDRRPELLPEKLSENDVCLLERYRASQN
jgi:tRNA (guanine37-N1)-methyltransferase